MRLEHLLLMGVITASQAATPPQDWWALHPLDRAASQSGPQSVDGFVDATLQKQRLQRSPTASRQALIRRACFDLTGLPPTPAEVEAFVSDPSPNAYPRLIERLLASPHYGEQWARHWLDVARYSDTKGYVYAREEKRFVHASSYRDWVVRAFNEDMKYDRFLLLQIAADQAVPAGSPDLAAMGFLTLGRRFLGVTHDIIDDRIDVVTRGTMGLTVSCARCHDHKFDPIPTRDYYALYGVFQNCAEKLVPCGIPNADEELVKRQAKLRETMTLRREEQAARVRERVTDYLVAQLELEKYPGEGFDQIIDAKDLNPFVVRRWQVYLERHRDDPLFAEWRAAKSKETAAGYGARFAQAKNGEPLWHVLYGPDSPCLVPDEHVANIEMYFPTGVITELWKLQGEVDRWLVERSQAPGYATILEDRVQSVNGRIFLRGNPLTKGDEVPRQFLAALSKGQQRPLSHGSGRLDLAQAIIDPANPLTARVMVNRVWAHHFGQGLVTTPSDFGTRAELPSHPELLDWLALQFIDGGWSLKNLHRQIMLSAAYQQSSLSQEDAQAFHDAQERDPQNRWLWRMNPHRLSFEEARDAWLAAAGRLDLKVGGWPMELFAELNARRTLYAYVDREQLAPVLRNFDFANPDLSTPKRTETTVPQQALFGMNHPFVAAQAKALRRRADVQVCRTDAERVRFIHRLLYQQPATPSQEAAALAFINSSALVKRPVESESAKAWQYGFGEWDESAGRVKSFTALPHFNGNAWQGGSHWPDVKLGWAQITAEGGHPGNDRGHAVVRRWTAPMDGSYTLTSTLTHVPAAGDGVRAFIGHSGQGQLRAVTLHASEAVMNMESLALKAGDTLDFVVDIGGGLNSDQFLWAPQLSLTGSTGSGGDLATQQWSANADFTSSAITALDPWEQLIQVLMLSNEFMFVD
ncbi:MAG: DUF1549 and DUF1553 domain-containing protein [Prosthecobacter sp.]|nr:DUF1549 and DUF1553 domain-containing protein [Prosthecobacter sp.]